MSSPQRNRLTERLIQLENAIRAGARSPAFLPIGIASLAGIFVLVSVVSGLIIYYRNKPRYTNPINGKIMWRDLILYSLAIGGGVTVAGSVGFYFFRRYFGNKDSKRLFQ